MYGGRKIPSPHFPHLLPSARFFTLEKESKTNAHPWIFFCFLSGFCFDFDFRFSRKGIFFLFLSEVKWQVFPFKDNFRGFECPPERYFSFWWFVALFPSLASFPWLCPSCVSLGPFFHQIWRISCIFGRFFSSLTGFKWVLAHFGCVFLVVGLVGDNVDSSIRSWQGGRHVWPADIRQEAPGRLEAGLFCKCASYLFSSIL